MELDIAHALILIVGLGVASQWLAWWLRMPAIVLFLVCGVVIGPWLGLVDPAADFGAVLRPAVELAVAIILFEGGLSLQWHEFRKAATGVRRLVTLGSLLAWGFTTAAAYFIGDLSLPVSLVFGAILIVTGPTVIIPLLRQTTLNRRTASYFKWEAIINDPVGAMLAVLVFEYFVFAGGGGAVFIQLGLAVVIALALGVGLGYLLGMAFNRSLVPEYLKAPLTLVAVLAVYGLAELVLAGAGLLAVTLMGMTMGNMRISGLGELRNFKETIRILMVSTVFVVLTANIDPEVLRHLDWHAAALVAAVIFLVRPAAVLLSTLFSGVDWRDRLLLAWIAPRGIVASAMAGVFGHEMMAAGYTDAVMILPLIFAVVFATDVLHGFTLRAVSRWLGLVADPHGVLIVGASPWSTELARTLGQDLGVSTVLVDNSWHRLRPAQTAGVRVLYGELLSEPVQESLELNEIACLLAATSNDAYNALVCNSFAPSLSHDRVFQLPMYAQAEAGADAPALVQPLRGRPAFHQHAQYEALWQRHLQGWRFHHVRLTRQYGFKVFQRDLPENALVIAWLRGDGSLRFRAAGNGGEPAVGDTVVYYAPGPQTERTMALAAPETEPVPQE